MPFAYDTPSVTFKAEPGTTWHFSENIEDLGGTVRTSDCADGAIPLGKEVCSHRGIAVLDDSDLPAHPEAILQQAQMAILMKTEWYDWCIDPTRTAHETMIVMGAWAQGYNDVRDALNKRAPSPRANLIHHAKSLAALEAPQGFSLSKNPCFCLGKSRGFVVLLG